jgi:pimeloyl-ACP methyl ester carboxylesterase
MPNVTANGIQIEYDTFGESSSPPLLLIMGLGMQMIAWDEDFCNKFVERGLYVIRFDNRDIGLSTKFEEAGVPDIMAAVTASMQGQEVQAPYNLDDMADDAIGLLDGLGIEKAHICGASMGAAITQTIGYRHPSRVLSLIPIMGPTGDPELPQAKPEAVERLITPAPEDREAYIEHSLKTTKIIWGSLNLDEEYSRQRAARAYDRSFYPQGVARQLVATLAHGNRTPHLPSITAPTLVIHGVEDPLVLVEHGKATSEAIPGAEMLLIDKMGHSLPKEAWPQIVDAIVEHTKKATA